MIRVFVAALWLMAPIDLGAEGPNRIVRGDDELLVLEVRLSRILLDEGLIAYPHPRGVVLPLGALAAALGFPITIDLEDGAARGWILDESRVFELDPGAGTARLEGRELPFDPSLVELHFDDLYVSASLLERWFPVDLEVDISASRVWVRPREKLPIEGRLERRRNWQRRSARDGGAGSDPSAVPFLDLPYRWLDWPTLDHSLRLGYGSTRVRGESGSADYQLLAAGDLLGMQGQIHLRLDSANEGHLRFSLGRHDPDGGLLGPLHARDLRFGDLSSHEVSLIAQTTSGMGFEISNAPLDRPFTVGAIDVRGDGLPGWQVELYSNGTLLGFSEIGEDGRYDFAEVPLSAGFNDLRLVFYGPQGQEREERRPFLIGDELLTPGESSWRFSLLRDDDEPRVLGRWERALRTGLAMSADIASLPLADGRHEYTSLGLRATLRHFFTHAAVAVDARGGAAVRLATRAWWTPGTQGRWRRNRRHVGLRFDHQEFRGFASEVVNAPSESPIDAVVRRGSLNLDGRFSPSPRALFSFRVSGRFDRRASGAGSTGFNGRLGVSFRHLAVAHTLSFQERSGEPPRWNGAVLLSTRRRDWSLRGAVGVQLEPAGRLTRATLTVDRRFRSAESERDLRLRA